MSITHQIPLDSLINYLHQNNWYNSSEIRDNFQIWRHNSYTNAEITLPTSQDHKRYTHLLEDALEQLAECRNISKNELLQYIQPNNFDSIIVRAIADDLINGIIQFNDGLSLLLSTHKLLKKSSTTIAKFKNKNKHIDNFMNEIGMGQTQIGSYIFTMHSPLYRVSTADDFYLHDQAESLGRSINKKFHSKLIGIARIVSIESENHKVAEKLLSIGIDKNDCDSIIEMYGNKTHRSIEIKVDWSKKEFIEPKFKDVIYLNSNDSQKLIDYRETLKKIKTEKSITLSGEVADLHRDYDDEFGRAKLKAKYQNREISVSFVVNEDIYPKVAYANVNKRAVVINGDLEVIKIDDKITASFKNVTEFKVIENINMNFD